MPSCHWAINFLFNNKIVKVPKAKDFFPSSGLFVLIMYDYMCKSSKKILY